MRTLENFGLGTSFFGWGYQTARVDNTSKGVALQQKMGRFVVVLLVGLHVFIVKVKEKMQQWS